MRRLLLSIVFTLLCSNALAANDGFVINLTPSGILELKYSDITVYCSTDLIRVQPTDPDAEGPPLPMQISCVGELAMTDPDPSECPVCPVCKECDICPVCEVPPAPPEPEYIGEDASGNKIALADELNGFFRDTLYIPTVDNPTMIVWDELSNNLVVYPGCAEKNTNSSSVRSSCYKTGSLNQNITYAHRVTNIRDYMRYDLLSGYSNGYFDHKRFDSSVSVYPGNFEVSNYCVKRSKTNTSIIIRETGYYCSEPFADGNDPPVIYVNFKAVGSNSDRCDNYNYDCRLYLKRQ